MLVSSDKRSVASRGNQISDSSEQQSGTAEGRPRRAQHEAPTTQRACFKKRQLHEAPTMQSARSAQAAAAAAKARFCMRPISKISSGLQFFQARNTGLDARFLLAAGCLLFASCADSAICSAPEETCGKIKFSRNAVLTYSERMLILVSSLVTTLLDRGVEQTLFDNLIDVPESVRPYSSPSSVNGDFE
jgi:hypothetical protein